MSVSTTKERVVTKQRYYAKDKVVTNYCSIKGSIELAKRIEALLGRARCQDDLLHDH
jgi:hypothetical protein